MKQTAKRMPASKFRAWMKRMGFNQIEAAAALGITRTTVRQYSGWGDFDGRGSKGAPPHIALACEALERRRKEGGS